MNMEVVIPKIDADKDRLELCCTQIGSLSWKTNINRPFTILVLWYNFACRIHIDKGILYNAAWKYTSL